MSCQRQFLCVYMCRRGSQHCKPHSLWVMSLPAHSICRWRMDQIGSRKGKYGDFCFTGLHKISLEMWLPVYLKLVSCWRNIHFRQIKQACNFNFTFFLSSFVPWELIWDCKGFCLFRFHSVSKQSIYIYRAFMVVIPGIYLDVYAV